MTTATIEPTAHLLCGERLEDGDERGDTPIYDSLEPLPAWDGCGDDTCQSCHPE